MKRIPPRPILPIALASAVLAVSVHGFAGETSYVVQKGNTLASVATRYHVSAKEILDANHLTSAKNLRAGETLIVPNVPSDVMEKIRAKEAEKEAKRKEKESKKEAKEKEHAKKGAKETEKKPANFAMKARTPGVLHLGRLATKEEFTVRVRDSKKKVPDSAARVFERVMRSTSGKTHPPEPRLLAMLGTVSDHFGSRRMEVISGYRPFKATQTTKHSNHNIGKAMDFRIVGVPNEVLRDYCKTLKDVGVGYYPNSVFVHLDVRSTSAFWIDYSKPGETPRYNSPDVDADEGASDIDESDTKENKDEPTVIVPPVVEEARTETEIPRPLVEGNGVTNNTADAGAKK